MVTCKLRPRNLQTIFLPQKPTTKNTVNEHKEVCLPHRRHRCRRRFRERLDRRGPSQAGPAGRSAGELAAAMNINPAIVGKVRLVGQRIASRRVPRPVGPPADDPTDRNC